MPQAINPPDHCSEAGANRLAARLRGAWYDRGYAVATWVEAVRVSPNQLHNEKGGWYAVRSDMVGGKPQRKIDAVA